MATYSVHPMTPSPKRRRPSQPMYSPSNHHDIPLISGLLHAVGIALPVGIYWENRGSQPQILVGCSPPDRPDCEPNTHSRLNPGTNPHGFITMRWP